VQSGEVSFRRETGLIEILILTSSMLGCCVKRWPNSLASSGSIEMMDRS
jgi:hypothetical protein